MDVPESSAPSETNARTVRGSDAPASRRTSTATDATPSAGVDGVSRRQQSASTSRTSPRASLAPPEATPSFARPLRAPRGTSAASVATVTAPRRPAPTTADHQARAGRAEGQPADGAPREGSLLSTPVHSSRGSGSYSPIQMMGVEGPPIAFWRPTEIRDVPRILELAASDTMAFFGDAEDIPGTLERSVLSLSQLNVLGEVVACLCLSNWPMCPSLAPSACPDWLNPLYEPRHRLSPANTLLVRLLVWDGRYMVTCARLLLYSVFVTLPALEQVVIVVPAKTPRDDVLQRLFDEVQAKGFKTTANLQSLLICRRSSFVKRLRVREAHCDDNDDLLQIFDQKAYRLRQLYGDFYISELIANPESRKIIVAEEPKRKIKQTWEMRPRAIGIMVLNSDVNLPLLNAHFQLVPFYGLRQPHARDVLNLPGWANKPRPEMEAALGTVRPDADRGSAASTVNGSTSSSASALTRRVEGLAARAARLQAEVLERRRRRWVDDEHYLSELSLTQEERDEPSDPFRLADVTWANVVADVESSSLETESESSEDDDSSDRPFKFHRKKKARLRTRSELMLVSTGVMELLPEFKGAANAFLVELFAMHEHFDDRLAFDFLVEAFRLFPALDYCSLTVPHAYPTFPLLDHFVRVAPRERRNFHQELYVAHRAAVLGELEVREAEDTDFQDVLQLIRTLKRSLALVLREVQAAMTGEGVEDGDTTWLRAYVACWQGQVVGLAVISDEEDWQYMACHYMVGHFADLHLLETADHGGLRVCLLSPVFQHRAGLFLRELHRLSAKTCLYYALFPCPDLWRKEGTARDEAADEQARQASPRFLSKKAAAAVEEASRPPLPCLAVPSILDDLIPVAPRPPPNGLHQVADDRLAALEEGEELSAADRREPPYALFLSTPRLLALPKATVNVRVVVVGASDAALSFLETLVFSSAEVRYNNLTLVSRQGLPGETDIGPLVDHFLPHRGRYDFRQLARLQLGAWVNVVCGMVTKIHRVERVVEVDGKSALPYDYLFVFCGQQFCPPRLDGVEDVPCKHYPSGKGWPASIGAAEPESARQPAGGDPAPEGPSDEELFSEEMSSSAAEAEGVEDQAVDTPPAQADKPEELPINVFLINTDVDVRKALGVVKQGASVLDNYNLVLYGDWHCPELLCCVAGFLHWGVPASKLLVVDPTSPAQEGPMLPSSFGDEDVEAAMLASMEASGVAMSRGCELQGWVRGEPDWVQLLREEQERLGGGAYPGAPHGGGSGQGKADTRHATHVVFKPKQGATLEPLYALIRKESDDTLDELAPLSIPCLAVFCFEAKTTDPVTFSALVDSGLVMDGLLVIDRLGRTNDPFILAAGPVTTYQRRLSASDMDHCHYSSLEVGRKLAEQMRRLWDPLLKARAHMEQQSAAGSGAGSSGGTGSKDRVHGIFEQPADPQHVPTKSEGIGQAVRAVLGPYWHYAEMVPTLTAPVVLCCELPAPPGGTLHFLRVRAPGPASLMPGAEAGEVLALQVGRPGEDRFCRVLVDANGFVRGVDCLAKQPIPVDMLVAAYGQHEDGRGNSAEFLDVISSPDMMGAVYHRDPYKTSQWQLDLDAIFGFPSCKIVPAVTAALRSNNWDPLDEAKRAELQLQWLESPEQRAVEQRVAGLLRDHGFNVFTDEVRRALRELLQTKDGWK